MDICTSWLVLARLGASPALKTKEGHMLGIYINWDIWTHKRYKIQKEMVYPYLL